MTDAPQLPPPTTAGSDALALPLPNAVPQTDDQQPAPNVQPGADAMANPDQTPAPVSGSASIGAIQAAKGQAPPAVTAQQPAVQKAPPPPPTNAAQHLASVAMDLIKNAPRYAANAAQAAGRAANKAPVVSQFKSGGQAAKQRFTQDQLEKAQNIALIHAQTISAERLNSLNSFKDQQEYADIGKKIDDEQAENHPLLSGGLHITKQELNKNLASAVGNPDSPWNPDKIQVNQVSAEKDPDGNTTTYYNVRQRVAAQRNPSPEMVNLWKSVDLRDGSGKPIQPTGPMDSDSIDALNKTALTLKAYNANIVQAETDTGLKQVESETKLQGAKDKITIANYLGGHPGMYAQDKDTFSLLHEIANLRNKDGSTPEAASAAARQLAQYDPKDMEKHFEDLETRRHNKSEEAINMYKAQHPLGDTAPNNVPQTDAVQQKINEVTAANPSVKPILAKYSSGQQASLMAVAFGDGSIDFDKIFPASPRPKSGLIPAQEAIGVMQALNPNFNPQEYKQLQNAYKIATTGDNAQAIQNYNNFLQHSSDAIDTLTESGRKGPRLWNTALNALQNAGYGTDATKIGSALTGVRGEIGLLLAGGYKPGAEEQKAIDTILSDASTPGMISAALQKYAELGTVRLDNINETYKRASNGRNLPNIITQATLDAAKHIGLADAFYKRLSSLNAGGTMFGSQTISGSNQTVTAIGPDGPIRIAVNQDTKFISANGRGRMVLSPDGKSWLPVATQPNGK